MLNVSNNYCYLKKMSKKGHHIIHQQETELVFILDKASHPLFSELTQPHSNFSPQLIPSKCTKKRFKHLFVLTAIQMYSASCHTGCSLSQSTSRVLQPRCFLSSLSVALGCFSMLLLSASVCTFTPSD